MHPRLFTIPYLDVPVNSYGLMIMLGFIAALIVSIRRGRKIGIDADFVIDLGLYLMITGIIGARIAYVIDFYNVEFQGGFDLFNVFDGGLNVYGIVLGWFIPVAGALLFGRKKPASTDGADKAQAGRFARKLAIVIPLCVISALAFGRGMHVIQNSKEYSWAIFEFWRGGIVFYGGLILATVVGVIYLKAKKMHILKTVDLLAPMVMLGLAFGRVGCLLNGCCWGAVTESPISITFPKIPVGAMLEREVVGSLPYLDHLKQGLCSVTDIQSRPVIPMQIYASLAALAMYFLLSYVWMKKTRHGTVLAALGVFYGATRFVEEMFRGDSAAMYFSFRFSQFISLFLIAAGLAAYIYFSKYGALVSDDDCGTVKPGDSEAK